MADNAPPPPPPPPPGPSADPLQPDTPENESQNTLDVNKTAVAAAPGKVLVILAMLVAFVVFILFSIFSGGDDKRAESTTRDREQMVAPAEDIPAMTPDLPDIPEPPTPIGLPAPPTLPPAPEQPRLVRDTQAEEREQAARAERLRSPILILDGGVTDIQDNIVPTQPVTPADSNSLFARQVEQSNQQVAKVQSGRIGNLHKTVAQGRIITAILETAINTDLPGTIRAVVSHDVYPEAGRETIIPKGSRLIGEFNSVIENGQERVFVIWTRVIRPDGVDAMLLSPLTDALGQSGIEGIVDDKFDNIFRRALLSTVLSIGLAIGTDEIIGDDNDSTSTSDSIFSEGSVEAGAGADTALVNALRDFGELTQNYLEKFIDIKPTILVDQGTRVNVIVNRDINFSNAPGGLRIIP